MSHQLCRTQKCQTPDIPDISGAHSVSDTLAEFSTCVRHRNVRHKVVLLPILISIFGISSACRRSVDLDPNKTLVMVTAQESSSLAKRMQADPRFSHSKASGVAGTSEYGLQVSNAAELDALSFEAHANGGCGALQVIDPRFAPPLGLIADNPSEPVFRSSIYLPEVGVMHAAVETDQILTTIKTLESYGTRHHATASGLSTPAKVNELWQAAAAGLTTFASSTYTASSASTSQSSVIAALPGTSDNTTTIIIGAHLDSINPLNNDIAPGADDDASGIAVIKEVIRVLAKHGATFSRRIEFHAYGAEEVGLIGSAQIASSYRSGGRTVGAMMQLDMTGYADDPATTTIYLAKNRTNDTLRLMTKNLINTYLNGDYEEATLTAGTSDHRSWTDQGFPTVFPFEHVSNFNKKIHTADDTSAGVNAIGLIRRFTQLTLAYLAHYAGLNSAAASYAEAQASFTAATSTKGNADSPTLRFALESGCSDGGYKLAVGGDSATFTYAQACLLDATNKTYCRDGEPTIALTERSSAAGVRQFSSAKAAAFNNGDVMRIWGLDANHKIQHVRTVQLTK